jgi:hypothetical protein
MRIQQLLILDPRKRLSAREALQHPYFDGVEDVIPPN